MQATDEISITLQAQEVNHLIAMLNIANAWFNGEGPFRAAPMLVQKITAQAQAASDQTSPVKANGADTHAPH